MTWIAFFIKKILWKLHIGLKRNTKPYFLKVNLNIPLSIWPQSKGKWYLQLLKGKSSASIFEIQAGLRHRLEQIQCKGIYLYMGDHEFGPSELTLWIDFLVACRDKNIKSIAWAKRYNAQSFALARYCDQIILQPGGSIENQGIYRALFFWRKSLAKLGIEAQVLAVSPYKSAMDIWSRDRASKEVQETQNRLMDAQIRFQTKMLHEAPSNQHQQIFDAQALIDQTPATDTEALNAGWISDIASEETLMNQLKAELVNWSSPRPAPQKPQQKKKIALLQLDGLIIDGQSQTPPFSIPLPILGDKKLGDETVSALIHKLMQRKDISGCVVYINSPGGSATASAAIGSALNALKQNMPVYALMGNVAASGGYWIASEAQCIFAHPLTLTGSIGVIAAKFLIAQLLEKLATGVDIFQKGVHAGIYSPMTPWDTSQHAKIEKLIQHTYQGFLNHVSVQRHIAIDQLAESAQGKVWTGEEAKAQGLIDHLGGLQATCNQMATAMHWKQWEIEFIHPKPADKTPLISPLQAYGQTLELLHHWQDRALLYAHTL